MHYAAQWLMTVRPDRLTRNLINDVVVQYSTPYVLLQVLDYPTKILDSTLAPQFTSVLPIYRDNGMLPFGG
jgi:hypothetical protein